MAQDDVARVAGVSQKTVSRVLNNEPNVRAKTREKVLAAVQSLQYHPNLSARSLASNRSFLVALLYDNPSQSYVMETLTGVLDACEPRNFGMMVKPLDSNAPDIAERTMSLVHKRRPDGLILTPPLTECGELLRTLKDRGIPFSCVLPHDPAENIGVTMDESAAACEITSYLVELGHRRIAHVTGRMSHSAAKWRLDGYREGLRLAGIRYHTSLVVQGQFTFSSGVMAARTLFASRKRPTAIFAANDEMATGVMWEAAHHGLMVPNDISVCGFDDSPMAEQVWPPLTTVRQPNRDMGRIAADQLLNTLEGGEGHMRTVPYTLCKRESTDSIVA
ncbi:LacI family DNA-binding transcriptional regulator [Oleiagrimonas sp. C23AA]|uniref:LacI family DNA-binding transcriptional regulator n=1 Tax=Oleiagrimonas sp. C23AA TaxID=2719047 RepID=UPI0031B6733D